MPRLSPTTALSRSSAANASGSGRSARQLTAFLANSSISEFERPVRSWGAACMPSAPVLWSVTSPTCTPGHPIVNAGRGIRSLADEDDLARPVGVIEPAAPALTGPEELRDCVSRAVESRVQGAERPGIVTVVERVGQKGRGEVGRARIGRQHRGQPIPPRHAAQQRRALGILRDICLLYT